MWGTEGEYGDVGWVWRLAVGAGDSGWVWGLAVGVGVSGGGMFS